MITRYSKWDLSGHVRSQRNNLLSAFHAKPAYITLHVVWRLNVLFPCRVQFCPLGLNKLYEYCRCDLIDTFGDGYLSYEFGFNDAFLVQLLRLTAPSTRNMFLPIYVTFWDAQNRPNQCDCIHLISMNLANMSSLQICPILDALSHKGLVCIWTCFVWSVKSGLCGMVGAK